MSSSRKTVVWLTYAWLDNATKDVEYIAQRLEDAGLTIRRDKWDLEAGRRLWEQIDAAISDSGESDAWLIYATENSLSSEPCKEEYAYALQRALDARGASYPILPLFR